MEYPHRRFQILLRSTMGPIDLYLVRLVPFHAWRSCTLARKSCATCENDAREVVGEGCRCESRSMLDGLNDVLL